MGEMNRRRGRDQMVTNKRVMNRKNGRKERDCGRTGVMAHLGAVKGVQKEETNDHREKGKGIRRRRRVGLEARGTQRIKGGGRRQDNMKREKE